MERKYLFTEGCGWKVMEWSWLLQEKKGINIYISIYLIPSRKFLKAICCRKIIYGNCLVYIFQLWYALAKTLSEKAVWALAMDRMLNMVSINAGLIHGPSVAQHNPQVTMAYLQGIHIYTYIYIWAEKHCNVIFFFFLYWFWNRSGSDVWEWSFGNSGCGIPCQCSYSCLWRSFHKWEIFLLQSDCQYWTGSCQTCK